MVFFLIKVGEVFDALTEYGAEDIQFVIAPAHEGSALSLEWKMKVGDRLYHGSHVLDREALDMSSAPDYIERSIIAEALERLKIAIIDGKTKKAQNDGS